MESSTMKEAYSEIQRLSDDMETRREAIAREIHLKDQVQRELDAIAETIEEIVINMYKEEFPFETIANLTDLTMEEVLRIVKSIDEKNN